MSYTNQSGEKRHKSTTTRPTVYLYGRPLVDGATEYEEEQENGTYFDTIAVTYQVMEDSSTPSSVDDLPQRILSDEEEEVDERTTDDYVVQLTVMEETMEIAASPVEEEKKVTRKFSHVTNEFLAKLEYRLTDRLTLRYSDLIAKGIPGIANYENKNEVKIDPNSIDRRPIAETVTRVFREKLAACFAKPGTKEASSPKEEKKREKSQRNHPRLTPAVIVRLKKVVQESQRNPPPIAPAVLVSLPVLDYIERLRAFCNNNPGVSLEEVLKNCV